MKKLLLLVSLVVLLGVGCSSARDETIARQQGQIDKLLVVIQEQASSTKALQIENDNLKNSNNKITSGLSREAKLKNCLAGADANYQANFESYCISEGRGANCDSIKVYNSVRVDSIEKEERDMCFKIYR